MSNINQTITAIGDSQTNLSAMRDINVHQYKPEFFEPHLDEYEDSLFISPIDTPGLVDIVSRDRLLILGGYGYDKSSLARHIAWKLRQNTTDSPISVKEWAGNANPHNFTIYFNEKEESTIFILANISPQNVDYNLTALYKSVQVKQRFIIASTNNPIEKWKPEDHLKHLFWQPQPNDQLYTTENLTKLFIAKLNEVRKELPLELQENEFEPGKPLIDDLLLQEVAENLKTPDSIEIFIRLLCSTTTPLTATAINNLVDNCRNDKLMISQWFHGILNDREKLIALGLSLFDGCFDDQFFAAMDELVEQVWHKRDDSLKLLDYCDLDGLRNYFNLTPVNREGLKRVESHLSEQRQLILETVWFSHRRQLLAALPVIETLVKKSKLPGFFNRELYGSETRCDIIRDVISETLCDIGLKSGQTVENTLLRLAADENLAIQAVVARAMARWRFYDQDEKLFDTLQRWQVETTIWQIIESFLKGKESDTPFERPQIYIKATVALTVGFASFYDPPNQLNQKLYDLIEQLVEDTSNLFILKRFCNYTLPLTVKNHVLQLKELLLEMIKTLALDEPIGASLAAAYQSRPEEVAQVLDSWYSSAEDKRPVYFTAKDLKQITHRDAMLATVAFAYGWLEFENTEGHIPIKTAFDRLDTILDKERNPYTREAALIAIIIQLNHNTSMVEAFIKPLFERMNQDEIEKIITAFSNLYVDQRKDLENGETEFEWQKRTFPVWIDEERPLTDVEYIIRKWVKSPAYPRAQQIAIQASTRFISIFEREEAEFIYQYKRKRRKIEEENKKDTEYIPIPPPTTASHHQQQKLINFVSWWVTLKNKRHHSTIKGLLPEVLRQNMTSRSNFDFLLRKWCYDSDDEIKTISHLLKHALDFINNKNKILFAWISVFILIITLFVYIFFIKQ